MYKMVYGRLLSRGFYQSASLNEENMNEIVGLRAKLLNFTSTLYWLVLIDVLFKTQPRVVNDNFDPFYFFIRSPC